jgi:transposase-like protein
VLVQPKAKQTALELMRKLLRKFAFVPERLVTDDLRSYRAAVLDLGIERRHERGRRTNGRCAPRATASRPGSSFGMAH